MTERLVPRIYTPMPAVETPPPRMRVLALDPGSVTGWFCEGDGGFFDFRDKRTGIHRTDRHTQLFDRVSSRIADLIYDTRPGILALEEMVGRRMLGEACRVLLGIRAVILVVAHRHDLMTHEINASEWQTWARQRGWTKGTDQNDAMHLWQFYVTERLPEIAVGAAAA